MLMKRPMINWMTWLSMVRLIPVRDKNPRHNIPANSWLLKLNTSRLGMLLCLK